MITTATATKLHSFAFHPVDRRGSSSTGLTGFHVFFCCFFQRPYQEKPWYTVHYIQNAGTSAHPAAIGIEVRLAGHTTTSRGARRQKVDTHQPEGRPQLLLALHRISRLARLITEADHNHYHRTSMVSLLPIVVARRSCRCCR